MFGKKENVATFGPGLVLNLVGDGTEIKGNINSEGDIRIDGKVIGNIITKSKMVLGASGSVDGDVSANSADISGSIKGNLTIADILFLKASGRIDGNISTAKMVLESGGEFNGSCQMHGQ
jgi:cytoskeletal protein CcmA (bactofilin family)